MNHSVIEDFPDLEALENRPMSPRLSDHLPMAASGTAAALILAACGGGGGGAVDPVTPPPVTVTPPPTVQEASRFLLQAQFSASDSEIAAVQAQGYAVWLNAQLNAPAARTGWDWLMSRGFNAADFANSVYPADYMMWNQIIASTDAVRKRVALALSEIFVVSSSSVPVQSRSFAMAQYWDVLAAGAFGNYRALLEEITLNPAMGVFLNTKGNQKANPATGRAPDENYSREVLQLFSIGLYQLNLDGTNKQDGSGKPVETYDQASISSLAQVFTGYDYDTTGSTRVTNPLEVRNRMKLNASLHATGQADFLGTTIAANTEGATGLRLALDAIFNHSNVGPFIGKQMIQRLVTSNPSPAYVARVTGVFNNNGTGVRGDLKAVVTAVLLDAEARDAAKLSVPGWGKQREPMLRLVQWARTFGVVSPGDVWAVNDLSDPATRLGQSPLRSQSVFNFFRPGYVPPNTTLATQGLTAPEFQLTNESTVAGYLNFMLTTIRGGYNNNGGGLAPPAYTAELALVNDPTALSDRLNLLLSAGQLSAATLTTIRTSIATISTATPAGALNRVYAAILLVMASPQYLVQK
jgi:uncharacterized protein (DUF1800 family)